MKMYTILIRAYLSSHIINIQAPWNVYKIDTKVVYRNDLHYLYDKHEATKTTFAAMEFYKGHKTLQDGQPLCLVKKILTSGKNKGSYKILANYRFRTDEARKGQRVRA